jgi:hypothetical protein
MHIVIGPPNGANREHFHCRETGTLFAVLVIGITFSVERLIIGLENGSGD